MVGFLFPTNEDAAKTVQPTVAALHHPTARFLACFPCDLLHFFTPRANVCREAEFLQEGTHLVIIIAFVQTHTLWLLLRRFRPRHYQTVEGGTHQLHVLSVRAVYRQTQRDAMSLGQQRAFHPRFAAIRRIGSGFFPHPMALWSSLRPCSASSNQSRAVRQIALPPPATAAETRLLRPIPESGHERWIWRISRSGSRLPTDSRFAARRRWRRHSDGQEHADAPHQSDGCSHAWATAVATPPTIHRRCGTRSWFGYWACAPVLVSV